MSCLFDVVFVGRRERNLYRSAVGRVLSVWQERKVFDQDMLKKLKNILCRSILSIVTFSSLLRPQARVPIAISTNRLV